MNEKQIDINKMFTYYLEQADHLVGTFPRVGKKAHCITFEE